MKNGRQRSALAALLAFGLFLAACSSGEPTETTGAEDGSTSTAGETTETTEPTTDTTEAAAAGEWDRHHLPRRAGVPAAPMTNESEGVQCSALCSVV